VKLPAVVKLRLPVMVNPLLVALVFKFARASLPAASTKLDEARSRMMLAALVTISPPLEPNCSISSVPLML